MAVCLRNCLVSDLCLGKPALRWVPATATVGDALAAIRRCSDGFVTVWACDHSLLLKGTHRRSDGCRCLAKLCMVDIICFLSRDDNLARPASALRAPVSALLLPTTKVVDHPTAILHVHPDLSLLEALDLMVQGVQNLVVQRKIGFSSKKQLQKLASANPAATITSTLSPLTTHDGKEFCWITQEDVVRFLLSSIGIFSPLPAATIDELGLVSTDFLSVRYDEPAASAQGRILSALERQTSVAVVSGEPEPRLMGEISPATLVFCDESVALAVATLCAGDLMAYIDCGGPPEVLVAAVRARVREKTKRRNVDESFFLEDVASSDEEPFSSSAPGLGSPTGPLKPPRSGSASFGRHSDKGSRVHARARRAEAIVCRPWSSLVAVMVQALAHRVGYVWVTDDDHRLVAIVTFSDILLVFRDHSQGYLILPSDAE